MPHDPTCSHCGSDRNVRALIVRVCGVDTIPRSMSKRYCMTCRESKRAKVVVSVRRLFQTRRKDARPGN